MPGKDATKLSKRTVDTLCVESKEAVFWDRDLPGFGVRVYTTGRKVYVVQSRGPDGPKRVTIGRHGKISAEQARKDAAVLIDRIKRGEPPVPPPPVPAWTVSALAERYMEAPCRGELPAGNYKNLPGRRHQIHPARARRTSHRRGGPRACLGPALRASRQALSGEPGGGSALEDAFSRRGLGVNATTAEPMPVGAKVPGATARAVSHGGRIPAAGPGAGCSGSGRPGLAVGHRCAPPAAADRMPAGRSRNAALGRCRPHRGGAALAEIPRPVRAGFH